MSDPDKVAQDKQIQVPDPSGDSSGQYMFANLQELDGIIAHWHTEGDNIQADGKSIAYGEAGAGTRLLDAITREYLSTLDGAFGALIQHNGKMYEYNTGYATKLAECRQSMSGMDQSNVGRLRGVGGV